MTAGIDFNPSMRMRRRASSWPWWVQPQTGLSPVCTWKPSRTWDVVAANLFSDLLQEVAPKIAAATVPGGTVVFSGILRTQEHEVVAAFRRAGLKIERVVRKGKWVSGVATHVGSRKTR